MENVAKYFNEVFMEIERRDPFHAKTLGRNDMRDMDLFLTLEKLIYEFFRKRDIDAKSLVSDYLHMISDMRKEMAHFGTHGMYSCKNQKEAYEKVYSKPEIMRYYMNALTLSQILWEHHFKMLMYFRDRVEDIGKELDYRDMTIMEVGAGHGLYSFLSKEGFPMKRLDIVDVSSEALAMTGVMLGFENTRYIQKDFDLYNIGCEYDLIIMGELLEHLDYPASALWKARDRMKDDGFLWVTVPINAPAIDHVFLFRSKGEVLRLIQLAELDVFDYCHIEIEGDTSLIGVLCRKQ